MKDLELLRRRLDRIEAGTRTTNARIQALQELIKAGALLRKTLFLGANASYDEKVRALDNWDAACRGAKDLPF